MKHPARHLHRRNGYRPQVWTTPAELVEASAPAGSRRRRLVRDGASMLALALVALGFAWWGESRVAVVAPAAVAAGVALAGLVALGNWFEARRRAGPGGRHEHDPL